MSLYLRLMFPVISVPFPSDVESHYFNSPCNYTYSPQLRKSKAKIIEIYGNGIFRIHNYRRRCSLRCILGRKRNTFPTASKLWARKQELKMFIFADISL